MNILTIDIIMFLLLFSLLMVFKNKQESFYNENFAMLLVCLVIVLAIFNSIMLNHSEYLLFNSCNSSIKYSFPNYNLQNNIEITNNSFNDNSKDSNKDSNKDNNKVFKINYILLQDQVTNRDFYSYIDTQITNNNTKYKFKNQYNYQFDSTKLIRDRLYNIYVNKIDKYNLYIIDVSYLEQYNFLVSDNRKNESFNYNANGYKHVVLITSSLSDHLLVVNRDIISLSNIPDIIDKNTNNKANLKRK